jgi:DNA polymerase I-like protein with 3'-5' exonuclease and polymerase domains
MTTYAVDFETYYDKTCSIATLGPRGYFSHPDFDAYLVTVVGSDDGYGGYEFVGHPKDFDWSLLNGNTVLSHNASFDESLYLFGVAKGWWSPCAPAAWHCTADMASYHGIPRSLAGAALASLGVTHSKQTRANMLGKRWEHMTTEFRAEVNAYAAEDSRLCLALWEKHGADWPETEREISRVNRASLRRGLPIDTAALEDSIAKLAKALHDIENSVPWIETHSILSRKAFNAECNRHGLEPPASLAMGDEDANEFLDEHSARFPWMLGIRNWRRVNALKKKLESFDNATMSDGRYYGGLMYFGAHTGRFSGSGGNLNLQNLPQGEMFGVDLRSIIRTKPGRKLVVVDLSQIEVRTLCHLAEDRDTMDEIIASDDIYEAFAIRFGLWSKEQGPLRDNDSKLRKKVKAMVLGCGYGCGAEKFATVSGMSEEDAEAAVLLYRTKMTKVTSLWRKYNNAIAASRMTDPPTPFSLSLPSGRSMDYGIVKLIRRKNPPAPVLKPGEIPAPPRILYDHAITLIKHSKKVMSRIYGGLVSENMSQAYARDVFCHHLVRIEKEIPACDLLFHVHDEVVVECDEADAEDVLATIVRIMSEPPPWALDLPLAAEGKILDQYTK